MEEIDAYRQLRQRIGSVTDLDDKLMDEVLRYFKPYHARRNELLLTDGSLSQYMNFVCKGCLRIFFVKEDGQEVTRYFAFENEFATGLASFINEEPSVEYTQAMEQTIILRIYRKDFYMLLSLIPGWEKFYRHYLEDAYINNIAIFRRETTKDAEKRYKELLDKSPLVVKRLPNKVVASYLNMSPETLSRMKRR